MPTHQAPAAPSEPVYEEPPSGGSPGVTAVALYDYQAGEYSNMR